jgi:hypothetical protein
MKINWNWGTKLFIATAIFMLFLLGLVYMTTLQDRSMVEDEYYQKSMVYQEMIDKKNNAKQLEQQIQINLGSEYLSIVFQDNFNPESISGEIKIYRPSDIKLDIQIPIKLDSTRSFHFPKNKLTKGKYIVKIDYKVGEKGYYQEQVVFVE